MKKVTDGTKEYTLKEISKQYNINIATLHKRYKNEITLKEILTKRLKPHLCKQCGETKHNKFRLGKKSICIKCSLKLRKEKFLRGELTLPWYEEDALQIKDFGTATQLVNKYWRIPKGTSNCT